jgi:hypothetical protein
MNILSRSEMIAAIALMAGAQSLAGGCAARVAPLKVQAFIVTKGKENVRLGLLSVNAATESAVRESLRELVGQIREEDMRLRPQLVAASDKRDEDTAKRIKVRLELAETKHELEQKRTLLADKGNAVAKMRRLALLETPDFREAVTSLSDRVSRKSDEALQLTQRLRANNDRIQADAELAKSMAFNDVLKGMRGLTEKRIEGKSPAYVMLNEFIEFYSGDVFKECEQERAVVLNFLKAAAAALGANGQANLEGEREDLRLAVTVLENGRDRLTQEELALDAAIRRSNSRISEIRDLLDTAWSHDRLFAALPVPKITKQTDPNGLVTLELDRRERWVLWAQSERLTPEELEKYYWIVGVPPSSQRSMEEPLFLSNDNLLEYHKLPAIVSE